MIEFVSRNLLSGHNTRAGRLQGCRVQSRCAAAKRLLRAHERTHSAIDERTH